MNVCRRSFLLRAHLRSYEHLYNRHVINIVAIGERSIHKLQTKPVQESKHLDFKPTTSNTAKNSNDNVQKADKPNLSEISERIAKDISQFFSGYDYSNTHKDIVLENRFRGKTYAGIGAYIRQSSWLRLLGHYKYAYVKADVLKVTTQPEDSTVMVHWRVRGITGFQTLGFFRMNILKRHELIDKFGRVWIEGISTFYINDDGFIVKHVADKVIPDQDKQPNLVSKILNKLGGTPKLAIFIQVSSDIIPNGI